MIIKKIKARNFRNIEECEIEFSDGVNILIGENAQGKTNAVEGIYFFARGKFFRAAREIDACYFERYNFSLEIEYEEKGKVNKISYNLYCIQIIGYCQSILNLISNKEQKFRNICRPCSPWLFRCGNRVHCSTFLYQRIPRCFLLSFLQYLKVLPRSEMPDARLQ